ncbi:MAG TPA: hypothetical protein VKY22_25510 [Bradyrhizobium sp.]|nr:hypothetical protein [Bradyrhizobium sp.]
MALPLSSSTELPATLSARTGRRALVIGLSLLGTAILIAALALWFRYGTTVFFETIASGIAGCF